MAKFLSTCACLMLLCLSIEIPSIRADNEVQHEHGVDATAKLKQSENEIAQLKAQLDGLKKNENKHAEQQAMLTAQLAETQKKAEASAAQAEQAIRAKEAAEKELAKRERDLT